MSADAGSDASASDGEESRLVIYVVPFVGVLLVAVGVPAAFLGGYTVAQEPLGLCGDPEVEVRPLGPDERPAGTVPELAAEDLSSAERAAVEEAIDSPLEEAVVNGDLENAETLLEGAIVEVDGERYFVRLTTLNECLTAEPLLFPVGSIAILLGALGVLTPPIYRKMAGFEERMRRPPGE